MVPLGAAEDLAESDLGDSGVVAGIRHAGPIAIAGLIANGANVVVTVVVARLLTSRGYGELAQLNGIFLFLSMPGSALLVGVVRRATALKTAGLGGNVRLFAVRLHRLTLAGVIVLTLVALLVQDAVARALSLDGPGGIVPIVAAGGIWLALSVDRGTAPGRGAPTTTRGEPARRGRDAHGLRPHLHRGRVGSDGRLRRGARRGGRRGRPRPLRVHPQVGGGARGGRARRSPHASVISRRHLANDVATAFGCLAFLALLQNLDVILLGREAPKHSGAYAAISVAAKAIVFGAIALGALPAARGDHQMAQGRARAEAARHHGAHPRRPDVRAAPRLPRGTEIPDSSRVRTAPRRCLGIVRHARGSDGVSLRHRPAHQLPPGRGKEMDRGRPRCGHSGRGGRVYQAHGGASRTAPRRSGGPVPAGGPGGHRLSAGTQGGEAEAGPGLR